MKNSIEALITETQELSRSKISRSWGLPYLTGPQVQVVPQIPHDSKL